MPPGTLGMISKKGDPKAESVGCARLTGKVMGEQPASPDDAPPSAVPERKQNVMTARVGQKAPDFTAPSYFRGGFTPSIRTASSRPWRCSPRRSGANSLNPCARSRPSRLCAPRVAGKPLQPAGSPEDPPSSPDLSWSARSGRCGSQKWNRNS
jgi:hypothetical protein